MNKTFNVMLTVFLFVAFVVVFTIPVFADWGNQNDSIVIAQGSSEGATPKVKGKLPDSEAGKKMQAAMAKYKNDPVFQQMIQEEQKYRQEAGASRKKTMDEQNAKIIKITDEYKPKIDAAKTENEKKALKLEMQGKINTMMQSYKKESDAKRKEIITRNIELEKKYGAKFPDYFSAKKEMLKEMQSGMNSGGKGGQQGSFAKQGGSGQGAGGNDSSRQKMMSIMQKYQNDPDFKKMTEEVRKARDDMRSQMDNVGENRSERMRIMQNFRAKMDDIEKAYSSKFPDYFKALEEMRNNRQGGPGGGGGLKGGKGPQ